MIRILFDRVTEHVAVRFFISGSTSAFVDLTLLFLLNSVLKVHYLPSTILAFICAFGVSFTLHKFWTFKSHGESAHKQVVLYLGTSFLALVINTFLMYVFVDRLHIIVLPSQIIVGLMVAFFSFFLSRHFVFKYKKNDIAEVDTV